MGSIENKNNMEMFGSARQDIKITGIIVAKIRSAILNGKLIPGAKLPSEKELANQFKVSKQTLREALRALEHLGLIEVRKGVGGGAFVVEVGMDTIKENLTSYLYFKNFSLQNLIEVRRLIEPYAAQVAAETITNNDLKKLKRIQERDKRMVQKNSVDNLYTGDGEFHRMLVDNTKNPFLMLTYDFVEKFLKDLRNMLIDDDVFAKAGIVAHERIYEAIFNKDPKGAFQEMYNHIVDVEDYLSKVKGELDPWKIWSTH